MKENTKIKFVKEKLEIAKDTTIDFDNYLGEVSAVNLLTTPILIFGPNMAVEVENQGRMLPQQWVLSGCSVGGVMKLKKVSYVLRLRYIL